MQITAENMWYTVGGGTDEYVVTGSSAWLWGTANVNFSLNSAKNGWKVTGNVTINARYGYQIDSSDSQYFVARLYIYQNSTLIGSTSVNIYADMYGDTTATTGAYSFSTEIIASTRANSNLGVKLVIDYTKFIADAYPAYQNGLGWDSKNGVVKRTESDLIKTTVDQLPLLLAPPVISNLVNNNPHNSQSGVSASASSISLKWDNIGDPITESWYKVDDEAWVKLSSPDISCIIPNLKPGSTHSIQVQCGNEAGYGNVLSITVRVRHTIPHVSISIQSIDLESLTIDWTSDKELATTQYTIDGGFINDAWLNLGQTGKSGTFTTMPAPLNPNTTHTIYFRGVSIEEYDSLNSNEASIKGTTYDIAHIQSISDECIFGQEIDFELQSKSQKPLKLQIWTTGNNREPLFEFDNIAKGPFTFTPTQEQLDEMYKCYTNTNYIPIYFLLITHGDRKDWEDTTFEKSLQLTGIAKTAHIGIDNKPRRAQVWIGDENKNPRRSVAWQGVDNKPRRCI